MKKLLSLILFLLVLLFTITLWSQNPQDVSLYYYFDIHWELSPALLILATFGCGMFIGCLSMIPSVIRNRHRAGKARRALDKIEREVQNLRAMPIKGEL